MNLLWQKCASGSNKTGAGRKFSLAASVESICQIVAVAEQRTCLAVFSFVLPCSASSPCECVSQGCCMLSFSSHV